MVWRFKKAAHLRSQVAPGVTLIQSTSEEAASYDDKHRKLHGRLTRELQARLDFIGVDWASDDEESDEDGENEQDGKPRRDVRLLDYACGTGVISQAFAPFTTQSIGVDISEKMVEAYNTRAENQGLSPDEMHAVVGDLASDAISSHLSSPQFFNFDIAVVGGGLHHFENPDRAVKRLVERLKPGGVLLVWDFLPHGPHPHEHVHPENESSSGHDMFSSVMHHGFSETRMKEMFTAAGAGTDFAFELIWSGWVTGHGHQLQNNDATTNGEGNPGGENDAEESGSRRQVFFARGTKGGLEV